MTPDQGGGIPGWFIGLFIFVVIVMVLLGIGTFVWRVSVARKIAEDAGLDPDRAAAVTMLSKDGVDATYLASALASQSRPQSQHPAPRVKTAEERLQELQVLKDKGLVTADEYEAQRQKILGSI